MGKVIIESSWDGTDVLFEGLMYQFVNNFVFSCPGLIVENNFCFTLYSQTSTLLHAAHIVSVGGGHGRGQFSSMNQGSA